MKHNRSMKDLVVPKTAYRDRDDVEALCSPKSVFPTHYVSSSPKPNYDLKTVKNTHSQKNLFNFSNISTSDFMASPKYNSTARNYPAVLTPVNKNLASHEQPKRPRILSKVRYSNSFG